MPKPNPLRIEQKIALKCILLTQTFTVVLQLKDMKTQWLWLWWYKIQVLSVIGPCSGFRCTGDSGKVKTCKQKSNCFFTVIIITTKSLCFIVWSVGLTDSSGSVWLCGSEWYRSARLQHCHPSGHPCQVPKATVSVLGLVGLVSVDCDQVT